MTTLAARLSRPSYTDLAEPQHLAPLSSPTLDAWAAQRAELLTAWEAVLGHPSFGEFDQTVEEVGTVAFPEFTGTLYRQPTGPATRQLVLVMRPTAHGPEPLPGAVVPFYHPDPMAGYDLATGERLTENQATQFGLHLVLRGFVVACCEAFPYNTVPEPESSAGFAWWQAAADALLAAHPAWSGIGKLTWDTRLATDLLLRQPNVDPSRILCMGHSLGGKMAFYTGAFDQRIGAVIASDFGIGWRMTNWENDWYHGPRVQDPAFPRAHHELLGLLAPRPFLLLAGLYDGPASWQYLDAAR
ncbi:MAG: acetylxylan esterase, partial [Armatimonadetes bacterium]|nr:acetylxylan esterase [Armatimonadota bacterium]